MLIALFVVFAVWNLALKLFQSIASSSLDPTDYTVFQSVFGAILTVIIALEFKRSLLVSTERQQSVVQVRTVVLIALLAIVRKLLILDVSQATTQLFALATAIIALGMVYWLVRDQDRTLPAKALRGNAIALRALGGKKRLPRRNSHART